MFCSEEILKYIEGRPGKEARIDSIKKQFRDKYSKSVVNKWIYELPRKQFVEVIDYGSFKSFRRTAKPYLNRAEANRLAAERRNEPRPINPLYGTKRRIVCGAW